MNDDYLVVDLGTSKVFLGSTPCKEFLHRSYGENLELHVLDDKQTYLHVIIPDEREVDFDQWLAKGRTRGVPLPDWADKITGGEFIDWQGYRALKKGLEQ